MICDDRASLGPPSATCCCMRVLKLNDPFIGMMIALLPGISSFIVFIFNDLPPGDLIGLFCNRDQALPSGGD